MLPQSPQKHRTETLDYSYPNLVGRSTMSKWPVRQQRRRLRWFPAGQRLIGLVRASPDNFVLPPAIVRKAAWRD